MVGFVVSLCFWVLMGVVLILYVYIYFFTAFHGQVRSNKI